jgi:hypothetical protein
MLLFFGYGSYFNVFEAHTVAVVLQQDMPFFRLAEIGPFGIFAV